MDIIAGRIAGIQEQIAESSRRADRSADSIVLMAVTKSQPVLAAVEAYRAGLRVFGENRVQEFRGKHSGLHGLCGARWHLIGHLQTNKAESAMDLFDSVDSVDSLRLAEMLDRFAGEKNRLLPALLEINIGGEAQKSGFMPQSPELEQLLRVAARLEHLSIRGLMTVPPWQPDAEESRPFFRALRELRDEIARRKLPNVSMDELSMGMSHDFQIAIEEGSTCIRIGTAIFGERKQPAQERAG